MSENRHFNSLILCSLIPGNIYVLFFRNGNSLILQVKKEYSKNGFIEGYDQFGRLTALNINCISGFGELSSFPNIINSLNNQRRYNQIEYPIGEEKKSFGGKAITRERNIEPVSKYNYQGKGKSEDGELQTQEITQKYVRPNEIVNNLEDEESLGNPIENGSESNENSLNYQEYKRDKLKNRNTLLSLKTISINGNSVMENSGRCTIKE